MKKVLLALTVASFAGFGSAAYAQYDLGEACTAAVAENAELTDAQKTDGCTCIVDGADDAMSASFEAGADAEDPTTVWTPEAAALVAACFPAPAE